MGTESVIGIFWDAAASPSLVCGSAPWWWPCPRALAALPAALFAFAFFVVVAAALLPIRRCIALAELCPWCFQSLVVGCLSSPCAFVHGQTDRGLALRLDGMFVFSWMYQVIAGGFVLGSEARLMLLNSALADCLEDASSWDAWEFH